MKLSKYIWYLQQVMLVPLLLKVMPIRLAMLLEFQRELGQNNPIMIQSSFLPNSSQMISSICYPWTSCGRNEHHQLLFRGIQCHKLVNRLSLKYIFTIKIIPYIRLCYSIGRWFNKRPTSMESSGMCSGYGVLC